MPSLETPYASPLSMNSKTNDHSALISCPLASPLSINLEIKDHFALTSDPLT